MQNMINVSEAEAGLKKEEERQKDVSGGKVQGL